MAPTPVNTTSGRRAAPLQAPARRAAIVDAVLPLLIEHGSAVTTRQLAQAAGVSEGTIFNVFSDKDELLAAALDTALDPAPFEAAVSEVEASLPFEERLVRSTELIQRRIVDVWRLMSRLDPQHQPSKPRPLPDSAALATLFASESDLCRLEPLAAARLLRALTLSLSHPLVTPDPWSPVDIVDVFLSGVQVRP